MAASCCCLSVSTLAYQRAHRYTYDPCACLGYNAGAFVHGQLLSSSIELCPWSSKLLTYHEVVIQWQSFLLRCITPPSKKRLLLAGTRLSVCFLVSHLFGLGDESDKVSEDQATLPAGNAAVFDGSRRPFPAILFIPLAFIHHCCGDPPATSALCNFRADDALGSVLVAPITAVRFVKLNNVISKRYCLVDENGVFILPFCDLCRLSMDHLSGMLAIMIRERRAPSRNLLGHLKRRSSPSDRIRPR